MTIRFRVRTLRPLGYLSNCRIIISDGWGKCKEKYSCTFIYNLQLNLYTRIDKSFGRVYNTDMKKEMTLRNGRGWYPLCGTSSTASGPPVHLAVPENCCGLALFLAVFDRCGNSGFASSATGSTKPEFPVRGEGYSPGRKERP